MKVMEELHAPAQAPKVDDVTFFVKMVKLRQIKSVQLVLYCTTSAPMLPMMVTPSPSPHVRNSACCYIEHPMP